MARSGSLSRQHQSGNMRRGSVNRDPLRTVVAVHPATDERGEREELECGHLIVIRVDWIGDTYAARRRCYKCRVER